MDLNSVLAAADAAASAETHVIELPPVVPGLVCHLDGDYLAYYASGNDETTPGEARLNAISIITTLRNKSGAENVVVHTTSRGSNKGERYLVATVKPYQGQRVDARKPKNQPYLQDWIQTYDGDLFRSKVWATREADDGIAYMAQWSVDNHPLGYCVIATADKDMRMLPGLHITWKEHDLVRVLPGDFEVRQTYRHLKNGLAVDDIKVYGTKWFWLQMLQGDTADNIPGLECYVDLNGKTKKLGEKTAEGLLGRFCNNEDAFDIVYDLYCGYYGIEGADRFVEQAALLWLRRDQDADLGNFQHHLKLNHPAITKAVARLKDRVARDRGALNQVAS